MRYFATNSTEEVKFIPSIYSYLISGVFKVILTNQDTREVTTYASVEGTLNGYFYELDITHTAIEGSVYLMKIINPFDSTIIYWSSLITFTDQSSTNYSIQDGEYVTNTDPDFEYVINND